MKQKKIDVADYDASGYDYEGYWKGREYEDAADNMALQTFLDDEKRKSHIKKDDIYIDIGGSYGRQFPIYEMFFKHIIL